MKEVSEIPETRASDSTLYYVIPLDVVLKYHGRATKAVSALPYSQQPDWLDRLAIEAREIWVDKASCFK